jgi:hypothetical protein
MFAPDRKALRLRLALFGVVLMTWIACGVDEANRSRNANDENASPVTPLAYTVPLRSDEALRQALAEVCRAAQHSDSGRALIEFSAAWCSDCRRLHAMKQAPVLARELETWPRLVVNVGQFDRHRDLLDALAIRRIAHWSIFEPTDCAAPLPRWPRIRARTLEVSSGDARHLTPRDLADWLAQQRTG